MNVPSARIIRLRGIPTPPNAGLNNMQRVGWRCIGTAGFFFSSNDVHTYSERRPASEDGLERLRGVSTFYPPELVRLLVNGTFFLWFPLTGECWSTVPQLGKQRRDGAKKKWEGKKMQGWTILSPQGWNLSFFFSLLVNVSMIMQMSCYLRKGWTGSSLIILSSNNLCCGW